MKTLLFGLLGGMLLSAQPVWASDDRGYRFDRGHHDYRSDHRRDYRDRFDIDRHSDWIRPRSGDWRYARSKHGIGGRYDRFIGDFREGRHQRGWKYAKPWKRHKLKRHHKHYRRGHYGRFDGIRIEWRHSFRDPWRDHRRHRYEKW